MSTPYHPLILQDKDNNLRNALLEDPHAKMFELSKSFDKDKIRTGRLEITADILFGSVGDSDDSILMRSAFFGGAAVVRQTLTETPGMSGMERGRLMARALHVPLDQELLAAETQESAVQHVQAITDKRLAEQPNLDELSDIIGNYYGSTFLDEQVRLRVDEYEAARMGVGFLTDVYMRAAQAKIQI